MGEAQASIDLEREQEKYRSELTAYCYRMLGSPFEAEDAVQDTFLRAWNKRESFEGRSSLRSWLYSIATNVCYDQLRSMGRRITPMDLGAPGSTSSGFKSLPDERWVEPIPDAVVFGASSGGDEADPVGATERREDLRLAFVALLQDLPPRQRAVFVLRDVLKWKASEVAELLETSVASVNSALQRARETLEADTGVDGVAQPDPAALDAAEREFADGYIEAFESYDVDRIVSLCRRDVEFSMPPIDLWLTGPENVRGWLTGPGAGCRGSQIIRTRANGMPAFGQYRVSSTGDGYEPWGVQVIGVAPDGISSITTFLDTDRLFPLFGLPDRL